MKLLIENIIDNNRVRYINKEDKTDYIETSLDGNKLYEAAYATVLNDNYILSDSTRKTIYYVERYSKNSLLLYSMNAAGERDKEFPFIFVRENKIGE